MPRDAAHSAHTLACYNGGLPQLAGKCRATRVCVSEPDPATGDDMREGIHPQYEEVTVHCGCGATWTTRSTKKDMHLDICSNCHPFFTGRQKLLDIEGRVDRFTKKYGAQTVEQRKTAEKAAKESRAKTTKRK
jgi:large subunit ribosomal protein L31